MQSIMSNGQCGQSNLLSFDLETFDLETFDLEISDNFTLLFCSAGHLKEQLSADLFQPRSMPFRHVQSPSG